MAKPILMPKAGITVESCILTTWNVKVGDTVLYGKYAGTELELDGTKYLIMRQSDILAIVE